MLWRASQSYDSYDALGQFRKQERRFSVARDGTISCSVVLTYMNRNLVIRYMFKDNDNALVHVAADRADTHTVMN